MSVFIVFLVVPLMEIYLLVQIGAQIGPGWTILCVVLTAFFGAWLVRLQGLATWRRFQRSLSQNILPAQELLEALCLLVSGALLLTPGFFTDFVGFMCLIRPFRKIIMKWFFRRRRWGTRSGGFSGTQAENPIDGSYKKLDD